MAKTNGFKLAPTPTTKKSTKTQPKMELKPTPKPTPKQPSKGNGYKLGQTPR